MPSGKSGPVAGGVVLSGLGTDGAVGLTRLKEKGGVTLVPAATLTGIETAEGRRVGDAMAPRLLHDAIPEGTRAGRRV